METNHDFKTFTNNRECLKCKEPIADQEHAATIFCPREVLPDGTIKSCKDDYHAAKNKERNIPYLKIFKFHKETRDNIEKLLLTKGNIVNIEDLHLFKIRLEMPVKIQIDEKLQNSFYYVDFCIIHTSQSTFKIIKHDNSF